MGRADKFDGQERLGITAGGVQLRLRQVEGLREIGPFEARIPEVSTEDVRARKVAASKIGGNQIRPAQIRSAQRSPFQLHAHEVCSRDKSAVQVIVAGGEVCGADFLTDFHQHSPDPGVNIAKVDGKYPAHVRRHLLDFHSDAVDQVRRVRVEGSAGRFREVPEHFVKLPDNFERVEHVFGCFRLGFPTDSLEEVLGYILAGTEAVEGDATTKAPRTKAVMNGA